MGMAEANMCWRLNEFCSVALHRGVPISELRTKVEMLRDFGPVLAVTPLMTVAALEVVERHTLSHWDARIWAAAKETDITIVMSEDFQHGRVLEGVTFVELFREA
jgi:predicted nucleic acid-binding protein